MNIRKVCRNCPFKEKSKIGFDAYGIELLNSGSTPCCHEVVGENKQFDNPIPSSDEVCVGYEFYMDGIKGFKQPFLEETP